MRWFVLVVATGCATGTPPPEAVASTPARMTVVVSGAGQFGDVAARAASNVLADVPTGERARKYLSDDEIPASPAEAETGTNFYVGALDRATDRIRHVFYETGFPFAHVELGRVDAPPDWTRIVVRFDVRTGPRMRFGVVRVVGSALSSPKLGDGWFSLVALRRALAPMRAPFEENGHAMVEVRPELNPHDGVVDVVVTVAPGEVFELDRVAVVDGVGNLMTRDLPLTGLAPGERYQRSKIEAGLAAVRRAHPGHDVHYVRELTTTMPPPPLPSDRVLEQIDSRDVWRVAVVFIVR